MHVASGERSVAYHSIGDKQVTFLINRTAICHYRIGVVYAILTLDKNSCPVFRLLDNKREASCCLWTKGENRKPTIFFARLHN